MSSLDALLAALKQENFRAQAGDPPTSSQVTPPEPDADFVGPPEALPVQPSRQQSGVDRALLAALSQGRLPGSVIGRAFAGAAAGVGDPRRFKGREILPHELRGADIESGIGNINRALLSAQGTIQGKFNQLQKMFGKDNVVTHTPGGEGSERFFVFREDERGVRRPVLVDPAKFELGDLFDFAADAAETVASTALSVPAAAAGFAAAGPPGAVAGAALADTAAAGLREGAAELLAGGTGRSGAEIAGSVGLAGLMGGVGQKIGSGVVEAAYAPKRALRKGLLGDAVDETYLAESKQLRDEFGLQLSAGQLTGSRTALTFEGTLQNLPGVTDKVAKRDLGNAQTLGKKLDKFVTDLGGAVPDAQLGDKIASVGEAYATRLGNVRSAQAEVDFGRVQELGGGPVLRMDNTLREMDSIIEDAEAEVGSDGANLVADFIERQKNALFERAEKRIRRRAKEAHKAAVEQAKKAGEKVPVAKSLRLKSAQIQEEVRGRGKPFARSLSIQSKASVSKQPNLIKDLNNPSFERSIATRLKTVLEADLDANVARGDLGGDVAAAIKTARDNYRRNSKPINDMKGLLFERALKLSDAGTPEQIAKDLLEGRSGTQVASTMRIIEKQDPELAGQILASGVQAVMEKSRPRGGTFFSNFEAPIDALRLAVNGNNPDTLKRLRPLFGNNVKAYAKFNRAIRAAGRLAERAGTGAGSQTTRLQWFQRAAESLTSGNPSKAFAEMRTLFQSRKLFNILTNPESADTLTELVRTPQTAKKFAGLVGKMLAISKRMGWAEDLGEGDSDQEQVLQRLQAASLAAL